MDDDKKAASPNIGNLPVTSGKPGFPPPPPPNLKYPGSIGKQIVREPLEFLKAAGQQISPFEKGYTGRWPNYPPQAEPQPLAQTPGVTPEQEQAIKAKARKRMQELEAELAEVIRENKEKEKALKMLEESKKEEKKKESKLKSLAEPSSKPSRSIFAGLKAKVERLTKRTETRFPTNE